MKVLLTGATGFIGSYILRVLLKTGKDEVFALRRESSSNQMIRDIEDKVTWVEASLEDFFILNDIISEMDAVIHCAGLVSLNSGDWEKLEKTNINATRELINLALMNNLQRFVHVSSVTALGKSENGQLITEQNAWQQGPIKSAYAKSKYLAEQEIFRGMAEGLDAYIINPSHTFGAGVWDKGPTEILKRIYTGLKYYPEGVNGIVDVRDVARMTGGLLHEKTLKRGRIICSNQNISHQELFDRIAGHLNVPCPDKPLKGWISTLGPGLSSILSRLKGEANPFTREALNIAKTEFQYDNSLSIKQLSYEYIPLEQTLIETCQCFLETFPKGIKLGILPI